MKINHMLAVILIASASQAVASSALTKFSPHVSRTALLATAAGHKYAHPIYSVQKRNISDAVKTAIKNGVAGAGVFMYVATAGAMMLEAPEIGLPMVAVGVGCLCAAASLEEHCAKEQKIKELEQQCAAQNKKSESQKKN